MNFRPHGSHSAPHPRRSGFYTKQNQDQAAIPAQSVNELVIPVGSVFGQGLPSANNVANWDMRRGIVQSSRSVHSVEADMPLKGNSVSDRYNGRPRLHPYTVSTLATLEKTRGVWK